MNYSTVCKAAASIQFTNYVQAKICNNSDVVLFQEHLSCAKQTFTRNTIGRANQRNFASVYPFRPWPQVKIDLLQRPYTYRAVTTTIYVIMPRSAAIAGGVAGTARSIQMGYLMEDLIQIRRNTFKDKFQFLPLALNARLIILCLIASQMYRFLIQLKILLSLLFFQGTYSALQQSGKSQPKISAKLISIAIIKLSNIPHFW